MPSGGEREAFVAADYNADMIEQIARYGRIRDKAIFVGSPDDIIPGTFGPDLPAIRDRLYRHLAVSDLAIVQGGLTATMELTAAMVPFIYVPLRNHFEQNVHVRARLDRYRAGR